ncbi:MAG: ribonuclease Y [Elusimicrobia bacterium]|nr:ribonuclease Y [Elusimicrobiota bacterium]
MNVWVFAAVGFLAGGLVVFLALSAKARKGALEIIEKARKEAEKIKNEAVEDGRATARRLAEEAERNYEKKRREIDAKYSGLNQKVNVLQKKEMDLKSRENSLVKKLGEISTKMKILKMKEAEIAKKASEQQQHLERISNLSPEEAKKMLIASLEEDARSDAQKLISDIINQAQADAQAKARRIIAAAVQKAATDEIQQLATTVVQIPSDDMKGRLIGKEGRNIKAFEAATGVELIVDDTPGIVTLSSFDGVRRYIGQLTIEKMIADGRIHPGRIEEISKKVKDEVATHIMEIGRNSASRLGITDLRDEIVELLGRMEFRFSYRQNILQHSLEVAQIAKFLAYEIGADAEVASRAGLLHDLGKAVSGEVDGSHAIIGGDIAKKYGEKDIIVNAIKAHHEEVPFESIEAVLVAVADALSATRPGARMESVEHYFKRIQKIEEIAMLFDGVEKAFAISAGRELRVIVTPNKVSEANSPVLAREIARKIAREVEYPGQIKVTLVREQRWNELA